MIGRRFFASTHFVSSGGQHVKRLYIIKSYTKSYRDTARNFDCGRSSHSKTSREDNKSFHDKRTQPNTCCACIANGSEERGNEGPGLQVFCQVWSKYRPQLRLVGLLQHGYHLHFKILPKLSKILLILSVFHNKNKHGALHEAVQGMLAKRAITHVRKPTTLGYYSRLFLVTKPMKRWRPVIDLSVLNNHLHAPIFKMETAESIRKLI